MKLHYYPETDSLYIELKSASGAETREIDLEPFLSDLCSSIATSAPRHETVWRIEPAVVVVEQVKESLTFFDVAGTLKAVQEGIYHHEHQHHGHPFRFIGECFYSNSPEPVFPRVVVDCFQTQQRFENGNSTPCPLHPMRGDC